VSFARDVARLRRKLLAKGFTLKPSDYPVPSPRAEAPMGLQAALFDPQARARLEQASAELAEIRESLEVKAQPTQVAS
jgi:hypothetical protein